jgi:hypothetical protein
LGQQHKDGTFARRILDLAFAITGQGKGQL